MSSSFFSGKFLFFVYFLFFSFLGVFSGYEIYTILEISSFLLLYLYLKSSTKEAFGAFSYLFCFSAFLGCFFFVDFLWGVVEVNVFWYFLFLSIGILMFFGKLPLYFFHYWLPKGHVEVLTPSSVILAALMLKFGLPFLSGFFDEAFLGLFFGFFVCFIMLNTLDYKVFVAYSSILHMTVFCLSLSLFSHFVCEYFLLPHTLLSSALFYYFSSSYKFFGVRIFWFFGSMLSSGFLVFWLSVPIAVNFLVELIMFSYLFFDMVVLVF